MRGPSQPDGVAYRHAPIAITVEGANILTRALIMFGQGACAAIRIVLEEMERGRRARCNAAGASAARSSEARPAQPLVQRFWPPMLGRPPADLRKEARLIARLERQIRADRRPGDGTARRQARSAWSCCRRGWRRAVASVPRVGQRLALQGRSRSQRCSRSRALRSACNSIAPAAILRRPVREHAVAARAACSARWCSPGPVAPRAVARPAAARPRRATARPTGACCARLCPDLSVPKCRRPARPDARARAGARTRRRGAGAQQAGAAQPIARAGRPGRHAIRRAPWPTCSRPTA